jgi:trk system potassium uptake protein TrkH
MGVMLIFEGFLLAIPTILSLVYGEGIIGSFVVPLLIIAVLGTLLVIQRPADRTMKAKGGFVTVALCWIAMSLLGSLPYIISGAIPSFVDALFETVSGFTTTGSTILTDVEVVPRSLLLWRSLTQWAGGMGILLFVIAVLPKTEGVVYQVFKAETPGPEKGKLTSRLTLTARILYIIYAAITVLLMIMLMIGGIPMYDSVVISLSTTSTGGFTHLNASVAAYNSVYVDTVLTVFMFLSSVNFTLLFFAIIGRFKDLLRSEELRWFFGIVVSASLIISLTLVATKTYDTVANCFRYGFATATSFISTTGFVFTDTSNWPAVTQFVLFLLMFVGGCAGSTAGGLKVSRVMLLSKSASRLVKGGLNSEQVVNIKVDGRVVNKDVVHNTFRYFLLYLLLWAASVLLVMATNADGGQTSFINSVGAVTTCLNNVGTALYNLAGGTLAQFSPASKLILTLNMLLGRLEILPILMLFLPTAWRRY